MIYQQVGLMLSLYEGARLHPLKIMHESWVSVTSSKLFLRPISKAILFTCFPTKKRPENGSAHDLLMEEFTKHQGIVYAKYIAEN